MSSTPKTLPIDSETMVGYLEQLLSVNAALVSMVTPDFRYAYVNEGYETFFDQPRSEIIGRPVADLHGREKFETQILPFLERAFTGESTLVQHWVTGRDAERRYLEGVHVPIRGSTDSAPTAVAVIVTDLTRRELLRQALNRVAVDPSVLAGDLQGALPMMLQELATAWELDSAEAWLIGESGELERVGRHRSTTKATTDEAELREIDRDALLRQLERRSAVAYPFLDLQENNVFTTAGPLFFVALHVSGRVAGYLELESSSDPTRFWNASEVSYATEFGHQITQVMLRNERSLLQEQLLTAQKRESLGILAGGIAHDFNNLLMGILGSADAALTNLDESSPLYRDLGAIVEGCERAAVLCDQLLAYAGGSPRKRVALDVNEEVRALLRIIRPRLGEERRIELDLCAHPATVEADQAQLQQVLLNVLTNAADAYDASPGTIALRTEIIERNDARLDAFDLAPPATADGYISVTIRDYGCGMTPEVRSKMFDPFFSAKTGGRGLGLAAVIGVIKSHNGGVAVTTRPGSGTRVQLVWPQALIESLPEAKAVPAPTIVGRCVLIVDDEPLVREVVACTLESAGYRVISADNGHDALKTLDSHPEVDALVLDLTLPDLDGDQVLARLRRREQQPGVVLISGFAHADVVRKLHEQQDYEFLQKPFRGEDLLTALRRVTE